MGIQSLLEKPLNSAPQPNPSDNSDELGELTAVSSVCCRVEELKLRVGNGNGYVVPALDPLDGAENRLLINWAFGGGKDDVRFRLRAALHSQSVQDKYQRIILDCPPRLTAASVNGLAAADFLLIPVTPNALATKAVVRLLYHMRKIRNINPHLKILGIVPNKTANTHGMSSRQMVLWEALRIDVSGTGEDCPLFEEFIPGLVALGQTGESPLASLPQNVAGSFQKLAERIDNQIFEI